MSEPIAVDGYALFALHCLGYPHLMEHSEALAAFRVSVIRDLVLADIGLNDHKRWRNEFDAEHKAHKEARRMAKLARRRMR